MDPDVAHDPVFAELLLQLELSSRKLRESAAALRSFYLTHHETPLDEGVNEKWRGAILGEDAAQRQQDVEKAAAQLLRYAFEIVPHSNCPLHMEELLQLKAAHQKRLKCRTGWGKTRPHPRGIEEKVSIDGGPPITLVIEPKHWEFTERAKRARSRSEGGDSPLKPTEGTPGLDSPQ